MASTYDEIGSGGAIAGGINENNVIMSVNSTGGVVLSGNCSNFVIKIAEVDGGVVLSGSAIDHTLFIVSGSGGAECSGSIVINMNTQNIAVGGHLRAAGHAKYESIRYIPPKTVTGKGRAIQGSILAIVPTPQSKLIKPIADMPIESTPTNPRTETTGIWCPVDQICSNGAALPKIVSVIQKGYIPNPAGTKAPRDRGIATATGI